MPILCGAYTTRYVGKGKERKAVAGHCVYDQGHDGPCLPPQLMNVDWVPVPKEEMTEAKTLAASLISPGAYGGEFALKAHTLAKLVESWPDPEAVPGG